LWETFPDAETLSEAIYLLKNNMLEPPECPSCEKKLKLHKTLYRYGIYCDMKCRSLKTPLTRISVSVNGKIYPSIKDATEETGISRYLLKLMLFDSSNSSCFYVKDHESTTQTQLTEMSSSLLDKQMLIQKKDSGMAMDKIAEEIGVSRDQLAMAYAYNQISTKFNQIPEATGMLLDDKEWLESQYKTMSAEEIGERNGVSSSLILQKLHHHGIEIVHWGLSRFSEIGPCCRVRNWTLLYHQQSWQLNLMGCFIMQRELPSTRSVKIIRRSKNCALQQDILCSGLLMLGKHQTLFG
jgi:hypothetical protein